MTVKKVWVQKGGGQNLNLFSFFSNAFFFSQVGGRENAKGDSGGGDS